ncbi:fumarylacetoacetase [archaeon]|nr:fumarylacetoacetase [archaeon]NDB55257.1 fumarylacetoacetase [archaeon]NDB78966.1 fumarylacetoacetase [archaeon]NDF28250.1 fumarylacetoacetase [archaeon]
MYIVDKDAKSFLDIDINSDFSIQNLPYGVFQTQEGDRSIGVAIGDMIFNLRKAEELGLFSQISNKKFFSSKFLNKFMKQGRSVWSAYRKRIFELLNQDSFLKDDIDLIDQLFVKQVDVSMCIPIKVKEFTDFYSSYHHAFNVGSLIRGPENALMPNWKHLPVAYHGRSSSIVLSGEKIKRPSGQILNPETQSPIFSKTKRLDFELEMGMIIGKNSKLGQPIDVNNTHEYIFGLVLVNDWSARDIQTWEYRPLGPFLGKNFATSISPWIVTLDALEPFKISSPIQDPTPLNYLRFNGKGNYDINLTVEIKSGLMKDNFTITESNSKFLYWSIFQQLAHHTINGCNVRAGDILASGTISGNDINQRGCLLEITELGKKSISISTNENRIFLEDNDTVTLSGSAKNNNFKIGFGSVSNKIYD